MASSSADSSGVGVLKAQRHRLATTAVEPSTCGTSWGSVRWNNPPPSNANSVAYRSSRFSGSGGGSAKSSAYDAPSTSLTFTSAGGNSSLAGRRNVADSWTKGRSKNSFSTTGTATSSSVPASSADRYRRVHGDPPTYSAGSSATSSTEREYGYLPRRTTASQPAGRAALLDIRQNLRPVKKSSALTVEDYTKSKPRSTVTTTSNASAFTGRKSSPSSTNPPMSSGRLSGGPGYGGESASSAAAAVSSRLSSDPSSNSLAISNVLMHSPSTMRFTPKSERPWRQRMADAARLRERSDAASAGSDATGIGDAHTSVTAAKILASRSTRRQMGGAQSELLGQPAGGGGTSSAYLVALQQRKLQENAEQLLHANHFVDYKSPSLHGSARYRSGTAAGSVWSGRTSRRDSDASSMTSSVFSTTSGGSALSSSLALHSMPSAGSSRHLRNSWMANSLYMPPSTAGTAAFNGAPMSRSYSPIRTSTVLVIPPPKDDASSASPVRRPVDDGLAPLAKMETSTISVGSTSSANTESTTVIKTTVYVMPAAAEDRSRQNSGEAVSVKKKGEPLRAMVAAVEPIAAVDGAHAMRTSSGPLKLNGAGATIVKGAVGPADGAASKAADGGDGRARRTVKATDAFDTPSTDGAKTPKRPLASDMVVLTGPLRKIKADDAAEDESKYNAVTQFKPASAVTRKTASLSRSGSVAGSAASHSSSASRSGSAAPVPGTWSTSDDVRYISQNRHLRRKPIVQSIEVICKDNCREKVPSKVIRITAMQRKILRKVVPTTTPRRSAADASLAGGKESDRGKVTSLITLKAKGDYKGLKTIKEIVKPKKLANALAVVNFDFVDNRNSRILFGVQRVWRSRPERTVESARLRCRQPKLREKTITLDIVFREQTRSAMVTIFSAIVANINLPRVQASFRVAAQPPSSAPSAMKLRRKPVAAEGKENVGALAAKRAVAAEEAKVVGGKTTAKTRTVGGQRPGFVVKSGGNTETVVPKLSHHKRNGGAVERTTTGHIGGIVLPSQSVLEEYVQRKRSQLERQASWALQAGAFNPSTSIDTLSVESSSRCESPPQPPVETFTRLDDDGDAKPTTVSGAKRSTVNLTAARSIDEKRTSRAVITDVDVLANERMIELLAHNNTNNNHNEATSSRDAVGRLENDGVKRKSVAGDEEKTAADGYKGASKKQQASSTQGGPFGALRKNLRKPVDVVKKTNVFDAPKSLFEERMQNQAFQLRRVQAATDAAEQQQTPPSLQPASFPVLREDIAPLSQKATPASATVGDTSASSVTRDFAAAIQATRHPHERYAAHIPISGRQSTTSVDSSNSGALDSASRSIDHMIDQARFRHQHNGNATGAVVRGNGVSQHKPIATNGAAVPPPAKFKEAIDYLDQIFEDLRKECEDAVPPKSGGGDQRSLSLKVKNGVSNGSATIAGFGGRHQKQQHSLPQQHQQQQQNGNVVRKNASTDENCQNIGRTVATNGKLASTQNGKVENGSSNGGSHKTDSRRSNVSANWIAKTGGTATNGKPNAMPFSSSTRRKQQQLSAPEKQSTDSSSAAFARNAADVDVAETVVLPSSNGNVTAKRRSNRMDFTQKWLADDIKTWADGGMAAENASDQLPGNASSEDDDRSLGSCSAEVAAINAKERQRRKRPTTAALLSSKKPADSSAPPSKNVTTTYKASTKSGGVTEKKPSLVVMEPSTAVSATSAQQPIRPQPYRPQPPAQYPFGSLGASSDYELHKVSSSDHLAGMMNRLGSSCGSEHRAASQDCSGSTHSHEGLNPTAMSGSSAFHSTNSLQRGSGGAGAFVSYTPQGGSIHSLPDAALTAPMAANGGGGSSSAVDAGKSLPATGYSKTAANKPPHASSSSTSFQAELELDTLVAELELNTNPIGTNAADKRRSFPTTRTEVTASGGGAKASTSSQPSTADSRRQKPDQPRSQQQRFGSNNKVILGLSSGAAGSRQLTTTLAAAEQRRNSLERRGGSETTSSLQRKKSQMEPTNKVDVSSAPFLTTGRHAAHHHHNGNATIRARLERMSSTGGGGANAGNPFETINQERLKPSRVEAIQHMFEGGKPSSVGVSASGVAAPAWQRKVSTQSSGRDEPSTYCEIGDIAPVALGGNAATVQTLERPKLRAVNMHPATTTVTTDTNKVRFRAGAAGTSNTGGSSATRFNAAANAMPAFPTTQPPSTAPPQLKKTEAGMGKLTAAPPTGGRASAKRLSSRSVGSSSGHGGANTIPSSTESVNGSGVGVVVTVDADDDDDGFYDNIRESRFSSTLSELEDNASVCSLRPPTGATSTSLSSHKSGGGRQLIGQLFRRIGGVAGGGSNASLNHNDGVSPPRPPMSAASLVSLNKVTNETAPLQKFALMKSNSLSNDRWKIANEGGGENGGGIMAASSNSSNLDRDDKTGGGGVVSGFSNRLKQSIFGSKKRLTSQS